MVVVGKKECQVSMLMLLVMCSRALTLESSRRFPNICRVDDVVDKSTLATQDRINAGRYIVEFDYFYFKDSQEQFITVTVNFQIITRCLCACMRFPLIKLDR